MHVETNVIIVLYRVMFLYMFSQSIFVQTFLVGIVIACVLLDATVKYFWPHFCIYNVNF